MEGLGRWEKGWGRLVEDEEDKEDEEDEWDWKQGLQCQQAWQVTEVAVEVRLK